MSTIPLQLVLNRSAIERVTGVPARRIARFELQFDDLIIIEVKPSRAEPAPKIKVIRLAQLEAEFHNYRSEAGRSLVLLSSRSQGSTTLYQVEGHGGDLYQVAERSGHLSCPCADYKEHQTICKHGWTVLHTLGYGSLAELPQRQPVPVAEMPVNAGRERPTTFRGKPID